MLKAIFSLALQEGWIEQNSGRLIQLEKENNARDRMLEPKAFTRLQAHSTLYRQAINLCAYQTEMRLEKILGLTWDKVNSNQAQFGYEQKILRRTMLA